jgi:pSer/pThr/pTyr-binding forkhead associated (FHA) protein
VLHGFPLPDGDHLVGAQSPGEDIHPEIDLAPFDPDHHLSRRHAILRVNDDKVYVADHPGNTGRGSTNGTWLEGRRVPTSMTEVAPETEVVFGKLKTRILVLTVPPG